MLHGEFVQIIISSNGHSITCLWGIHMGCFYDFNLLWPSDTIWRHGSGSTLAQLMACCWWHQAITWTHVDLSWVRFSNIRLWTISQETPQPSITKISLKNYLSKIAYKSPRGQWVNSLAPWRQDSNFKSIIFKLIIQNTCSRMGTCCEITLKVSAKEPQ